MNSDEMLSPGDRPLLVARARAAAERAYAPYSGFSVGCAIESAQGEIVTGANMENACYRLGTCAEIAALTAAQHAFGLAAIRRIAVAGGRLEQGRLRGDAIVAPCGGCRQAIYEAAGCAGIDIEILSASGDGSRFETARISELLPGAFGPESLEASGPRQA